MTEPIQKKKQHAATENRVVITRRGGGWRTVEMSEGSQLHGDGWKLNF